MMELISRLTEYPHLLEQMEPYLCNKVVAFVELHHLEDWAIILLSLKVCERLCDEETFLQCIFDRSTVASLLKIFEKSCNEWKDVQSSNLIGFLVTRILLTLLEKKDGVKKIIKDNGGQDLYGVYVDGNEGDQKTNALAVRLLHKLFDDMPLQSLPNPNLNCMPFAPLFSTITIQIVNTHPISWPLTIPFRSMLHPSFPFPGA
jgi:hypothetical protein